jgi:hypothetical protein
MNGNFYGSDGMVHNISELSGGGGGGGGVSKAYVDSQDTATLNSAKAYADTKARPLTKQEFWTAVGI